MSSQFPNSSRLCFKATNIKAPELFVRLLDLPNREGVLA